MDFKRFLWDLHLNSYTETEVWHNDSICEATHIEWLNLLTIFELFKRRDFILLTYLTDSGEQSQMRPAASSHIPLSPAYKTWLERLRNIDKISSLNLGVL